MSILETVLVYAGIPLGIYAVIAGLSFLSTPLPGKKPTHFTLGEQWTQPPVLWSATDEMTIPGHHSSVDLSHGTSVAVEPAGAELIGGRAGGTF